MSTIALEVCLFVFYFIKLFCVLGFQITPLFLYSTTTCIMQSLLHLHSEYKHRLKNTKNTHWWWLCTQLSFVRSCEAKAYKSRLEPLHCESSLWCDGKRPPSERISRCISPYQHFATECWQDIQQVWRRLNNHFEILTKSRRLRTMLKNLNCIY
jgi:hypothetical protein